MRAGIDALTIIAWNIWVGTGAQAARTALKVFIKNHKPHVIALMEANNLYGDLHGLGYQVVHMRPKPLRKGNLPAQGNIALLVVNGVEIKRRKALRMRRFWKGPKHGRNQDPRVYRWIKIKYGGRIWKIGAAHTPFGPAARLESRNRLVRWFKRTRTGRPTILVIDANMKLPEFDKTIAEPAGAEAAGHHIDLTAYKNCELVGFRKLGKRVSDHPAMLYRFKAKRRVWPWRRRKESA